MEPITFSEAIIGQYYRVIDTISLYCAIIKVSAVLQSGFQGPRLVEGRFDRDNGATKCTANHMNFVLYPATIQEIAHLDTCIKVGKYIDMPNESTINNNYQLF